MTLNYDNIPPPAIIEDLDFERFLETSISDLVSRDPTYSEILESDPGVKILEVNAYKETLFRSRVNEAVRAVLVRYSAGTDLDNIASNYHVERLTGESDAAFRLRVIERIQGSSAAGSPAWYRFHALSADVDIAEIGIERGDPGVVEVAVLSRIGDGTPSEGMLAAVETTLLSDSVRVVTDTVNVSAAVIVKVPVTATIYLQPQAPSIVFDQLGASLQAAFEREARLGWDVTESWLIAQLQADGVQRVELAAPAATVQCASNAAARLGAVNLTYGGRDY